MVNSSCRQNGRSRLYACPLTQYILTSEYDCKSAINFLATLATSASGLVLANTLIDSFFQVTVMADWLLHMCSMLGGEKT
jgi:hypothetical protein